MRIGIVGIVVEDRNSSEKVNKILSEYGHIIVGRMGVPHEKRGVCVISTIVDGTNDEIGAMCGKLGRIENVNVKSVLTAKEY